MPFSPNLSYLAAPPSPPTIRCHSATASNSVAITTLHSNIRHGRRHLCHCPRRRAGRLQRQRYRGWRRLRRLAKAQWSNRRRHAKRWRRYRRWKCQRRRLHLLARPIRQYLRQRRRSLRRDGAGADCIVPGCPRPNFIVYRSSSAQAFRNCRKSADRAETSRCASNLGSQRLMEL
jgi:hypothetical protein